MLVVRFRASAASRSPVRPLGSEVARFEAGLRSDDGSLVGLRGGQSADVPGLSGTKIRIAGLTLVKREGISAVERPGRCLGLLCGGRLE